jgi:hypothetical protein
LFLIFALALAGCSGDGGAEHTWDGPPDPGFGGSVEVEGFVEHAESVDEAWEGSPVMAATEFLRLDERSATRTSVVATTTAEGAGPHAVIVTLDGLLDDSVRTERWTLLFEPDGDTFTLTTAQWSQRCQPGRGHRGYAAEACV